MALSKITRDRQLIKDLRKSLRQNKPHILIFEFDDHVSYNMDVSEKELLAFLFVMYQKGNDEVRKAIDLLRADEDGLFKFLSEKYKQMKK